MTSFSAKNSPTKNPTTVQVSKRLKYAPMIVHPMNHTHAVGNSVFQSDVTQAAFTAILAGIKYTRIPRPSRLVATVNFKRLNCGHFIIGAGLRAGRISYRSRPDDACVRQRLAQCTKAGV